MDEACAYTHTPMEFRFCPFGFSFEVLIRLENYEQICLVNPQHHQLKVDSSCENTPAKLQNFYETESRKAKKVAKRDENSFF